MVDTNASAGSPEKIPDRDADGNEPSDHELDELPKKIEQSFSLKGKYMFWEKQPVLQVDDLSDSSLPEGPIQFPTEVRQEAYNLPAGYEWVTCDITSNEVWTNIYQLLAKNFLDEPNAIFDISKEFLLWNLQPPYYHPSWHVGVCIKTSKKLVAFIAAVPSNIWIRGNQLSIADVKFLCVDKRLRSKRLTPVLIKELTRRVQLKNVWQASYAQETLIPTPIASYQYWIRYLNPKKLVEVNFAELGDRMTMSRAIKLYKVPKSIATPGFRKMVHSDASSVTLLLNSYLKQFEVAAFFDREMVEHWFLPIEGVVDSFVVESADPGNETNEITDFCSFYTMPKAIHENQEPLKMASSIYNISTRTPPVQLMMDALVVAKQKHFDIFAAPNIMYNESFLKELKFTEGRAVRVFYYLYNYRIRPTLKESELGHLSC